MQLFNHSQKRPSYLGRRRSSENWRYKLYNHKVGSFANSNLQSIAHSTLIFADAPTDEDDVIRNGVYLTPHQLPKITIGTTIDYLVNGA